MPIHFVHVGGDELRQSSADDSIPFADGYGIGTSGASLVRPDGYVAWRSTDDSHIEHLTAAVRTVLRLD